MVNEGAQINKPDEEEDDVYMYNEVDVNLAEKKVNVEKKVIKEYHDAEADVQYELAHQGNIKI